MAPTEILARQHFLNLIQYLYPLGVQSELFIGTMSYRERREARERLSGSQVDLAVGTHAPYPGGRGVPRLRASPSSTRNTASASSSGASFSRATRTCW